MIPDVVCVRCGKDGFVWNRTVCFHCGFDDPTRTVLAPAEHEAKLALLAKLEAEAATPSPLPPPDLKCPHCERKGFVWKRSYCEYCGYDPATEGLGHPIAAYSPAPWPTTTPIQAGDGTTDYIPAEVPKGIYQGGGTSPMFPAPSPPKPLGRRGPEDDASGSTGEESEQG